MSAGYKEENNAAVTKDVFPANVFKKATNIHFLSLGLDLVSVIGWPCLVFWGGNLQADKETAHHHR